MTELNDGGPTEVGCRRVTSAGAQKAVGFTACCGILTHNGEVFVDCLQETIDSNNDDNKNNNDNDNNNNNNNNNDSNNNDCR